MRRLATRWLMGSLALTLGLGGALADDAPPAPVAETEQLPAGATVVKLEAQPTAIELTNKYAYRQLLLTAVTAAGERLDATRLATLTAPSDRVTVSPSGQVRAAIDGEAQLVFELAGQSVTVPVKVSGVAAPYTVSFVRDVMPVMSKMGCNAGTCHGSDGGKNGFKLSLRGYDPEFDHRALTDDLAGRRFNRAAPEQSLMLLKPSGGVPHVGGVLTRPGEPYYGLLREWIAAGVKLDLDTPRVTKIELAPQGPQISLPGMKLQMTVLAHYSDGAVRDVTAEAFIDSSLTEVAECDKRGLVTAVRRGEAAMLARYEGNYAATTVTVMGDRTGFVWHEPPHNNYIDELVYRKLAGLKVEPSDLCSDADFIRRVSLDLTGLAPTADEVRAFLADGRETWIKRQELIDRLIGSPSFVDYWTNKWSDLLQVNRRFLSEKGAWALRNWIRQAVASNMPYDQFAHAILTGSGSTFVNPPAAYLRVLREPTEAMENSTQLFLGVRFNCNKCHDHPFERWTQNQYYELSAFFAQVGRKAGANPDEEIVFDTTSGEVQHVKTGQVMAPAFPYQRELASDDAPNRRAQFADWVVSKDNQYFATSYVNRIWSYLLGVGLIEPVDDIRAGNPPSNPELLQRMTDEFVAEGFNVRQLMRTICQSRAYQHSIIANKWNEDDQTNYSHALARRLPAETLYDAIERATGTAVDLPGVPAGYRAAQLPDPNVELPGRFLGLFGRPPRESACECERSSGVVLGQALNLVNGPVIAEAIAGPQNRITALANKESDDAKLVEELFLSILCRPPRADESETGIQAIREADNRLSGAQDLAWALINSPAFLFNH
ncbi:MAG: DUF1549 and DUF1553 domain-containing protein [Pirellulales bacterium]|nr:DUF1549 and DUF1553 domain-containing protein [Pirellulales bacterium]